MSTAPRQVALTALATLGWLSLAAFCLRQYDWLGFPDGHLTDLARARQRLLGIGSALSLVGAAASFALGPRSPRAAVAAVGFAIALYWVVDVALSANLDNGGGG